MAFVNETVPEDQKGKIAYLKKSRYGGAVQKAYKWTIDRYRNAYLVCLESGGGGRLGTPVREVYLFSKGNLFILQLIKKKLSIKSQTIVLHGVCMACVWCGYSSITSGEN